MAEKKIIAVTGATGAQGGGLVRAIQADASGPFRARAITRNPSSDKARALAALGLAAALTLLLQPLCGAYESTQQPDDAAACCLEVQPDALVAAPATAVEKAVASALAAVPSIPLVAFPPAAISGGRAAWKDPPPPSLSYHARSARIQR